MNGYVRVYRAINEWEWKTDPFALALFIHILTNASFREHKWRGITVLPGQLITGRDKLSSETGISPQRIRTSMTRLKSTSAITSESTSLGTLITVVNWAKYQASEETSTSESTSESTAHQPAINQRSTSDQPLQDKVYNVYNVTNTPRTSCYSNIKTQLYAADKDDALAGNTHSPFPAVEIEQLAFSEASPAEQEHVNIPGETSEAPAQARTRKQDEMFDRFWKVYPRKVGKIEARRTWTAAKVNEATLPVILAAVEAQAQTEDWQKNDCQFVPYPAKWIRNKQWQDEIPHKERIRREEARKVDGY